MHDPVIGRRLEPGHEEDPRRGEFGEPAEIGVPLVEDQDRPGRKRLRARDRPFVVLAVGDHQQGREIAVMIEREVQLHGPFGAAKHGPRKHLRAQIEHRHVETEQRVLEPERLRAGDLATPRQYLIEHRLIQRPLPVRIGVRERRPTRRRRAEMRQLALATRQPPADLA